MPRTSKETAKVDDYGIAEDRHDELEGYTVNFVSIREDVDITPLFKGLPDDRCQSPHWGYVFEGRLTLRFADREEAYEAGDAFYIPPGHTPAGAPGTSFVQFSPTHLYAETLAAIERNMQALQGA